MSELTNTPQRPNPELRDSRNRVQDKTVTIRHFHFRVFRVFRGPFFFGFLLCSPAMKTNLIYEAESYQIIGACFEVYREKGCGFLEPVYQECMEIELRLRGVPFVPQKPLALDTKAVRFGPSMSRTSSAMKRSFWNSRRRASWPTSIGHRCKTTSRRPGSSSGCWSTLATIPRSKLSASWRSGADTALAPEADR